MAAEENGRAGRWRSNPEGIDGKSSPDGNRPVPRKRNLGSMHSHVCCAERSWWRSPRGHRISCNGPGQGLSRAVGLLDLRPCGTQSGLGSEIPAQCDVTDLIEMVISRR